MSKTHSNIKIIASDMDGTLLKPDHTLGDKTKKVLKELHQKGLAFIFATGRHHIDVSSYVKKADIPAYMITANGAQVHTSEGKLIHQQNVPSELVKPIVDKILSIQSEAYIHIYTSESWLLNRENEAYQSLFNKKEFSYKTYDAITPPSEDVIKLFVTNKNHQELLILEAELNKQFSDKLHIAFSSLTCLEIMDKSTNKGTALQAVAESLGYGLENCIAFGDGMNDVEMLEMAGTGLIMATAHDRLIKQLPNNQVIGSCADEAVAQYITDNILTD